MRFVIAVPEDVPGRLDAVVRRARELEDAWWSGRVERARAVRPAPGQLTAAARRQATAAAWQERHQHRAAGHLLGSRDRLVAHAVTLELAARGWDHDWPPVPDPAATTPGRRWGTVPLRLRAKISLELPSRLGDQVRSAAYWTSAEAVEQLQAWHDRYGRGPAGGDPDAPRAGVEALTERDRWRARVTTTGDIIRAGIIRAITAGAPTPPPAPGAPTGAD